MGYFSHPLDIGFHHADTRQVFLHARTDICEQFLDFPIPRVDAPCHAVHGKCQERHGDQRAQGQFPIDQAHHGKPQGQGNGRIEEHPDSKTQKHANRIDIVGRSGHQVAGRHPVVVCHRHGQKMCEILLPNIILDVLRCRLYLPAHAHAKKHLHHGQSHNGQGVECKRAENGVLRPCFQPCYNAIDRQLQKIRNGARCNLGKGHQRDTPQDTGLVISQIRPERFDKIHVRATHPSGKSSNQFSRFLARYLLLRVCPLAYSAPRGFPSGWTLYPEN